ncbi:phosphotransferase family protein [Marinobacter sp.]|uniref:phosphotransferase family protein n=1 Tax=Marinobacter sp. TaxID=50741 RepID=UPI0023564793|nr:phosphotransferase family protein [Marinobacter sp.]
MKQFPKESVSQFVKEAAGAETVEVSNVRLLSGGAIQENWRVDFHIQGGEYAGKLESVVRRDSSASGVAISHGREQEFALLKRVFEAGVTVPEPLWLSGGGSEAEAPFFIMRRIIGTASAHTIVKDLSYASDRVKLAEDLGRELAKIHSITPPDEALGFLSEPSNQPAITQIAKHREFLDTHHTAYPALEWGLRWLERNAPSTAQVTLCHGDYRTGNYIVDQEKLTGILDWEFTGWSDPLEDIGWFCAKCWRFGRQDLEAGGIGHREDFYRGYEQESGKSIDRSSVFYWEVMAHLNWAVIAIQQGERHCSGREKSLLLALTAHIVPELEWNVLKMTENG